MPAPSEAAAKIGIRRAVVAVLLVISVKNVTVKATIAIIMTIDRRVTPERASPIAPLIPVAVNAFAIAIPPAKSSRTPQWMPEAVSQSNNFPPLPLGIMNMNMTAVSATAA